MMASGAYRIKLIHFVGPQNTLSISTMSSSSRRWTSIIVRTRSRARNLQGRALRLGNQLDIEECLTNAGLRILDQSVGRGIDALHAGDKTKSPARTPRLQVPSVLIAPGD